MNLLPRLASVVLLSASVAPADLDRVMAEPNLEKRSRVAVDNANAALDRARDAYQQGENDAMKGALDEVAESVRLAYRSLQETGKKPRRNSRPYKRAEIGTRKLLRRLESFRDEMSYLDREAIEPVLKIVEEIQNSLLKDVMGGGR